MPYPYNQLYKEKKQLIHLKKGIKTLRRKIFLFTTLLVEINFTLISINSSYEIEDGSSHAYCKSFNFTVKEMSLFNSGVSPP